MYQPDFWYLWISRRAATLGLKRLLAAATRSARRFLPPVDLYDVYLVRTMADGGRRQSIRAAGAS